MHYIIFYISVFWLAVSVNELIALFVWEVNFWAFYALMLSCITVSYLLALKTRMKKSINIGACFFVFVYSFKIFLLSETNEFEKKYNAAIFEVNFLQSEIGFQNKQCELSDVVNHYPSVEFDPYGHKYQTIQCKGFCMVYSYGLDGLDDKLRAITEKEDVFFHQDSKVWDLWLVPPWFSTLDFSRKKWRGDISTQQAAEKMMESCQNQ